MRGGEAVDKAVQVFSAARKLEILDSDGFHKGCFGRAPGRPWRKLSKSLALRGQNNTSKFSIVTPFVKTDSGKQRGDRGESCRSRYL